MWAGPVDSKSAYLWELSTWYWLALPAAVVLAGLSALVRLMRRRVPSPTSQQRPSAEPRRQWLAPAVIGASIIVSGAIIAVALVVRDGGEASKPAISVPSSTTMTDELARAQAVEVYTDLWNNRAELCQVYGRASDQRTFLIDMIDTLDVSYGGLAPMARQTIVLFVAQEC